MITNWKKGTSNPTVGESMADGGLNVTLYVAGDLGAASFKLTIKTVTDAVEMAPDAVDSSAHVPNEVERLVVDWKEGKEYVDYVKTDAGDDDTNSGLKASGDTLVERVEDGDAGSPGQQDQESQRTGGQHALSAILKNTAGNVGDVISGTNRDTGSLNVGNIGGGESNRNQNQKTSVAVYKCFAICLVHSTPKTKTKKHTGKSRKEYIAIGGQNGRLIVFDVEKEGEPIREAKLKSSIGNGNTEIHAVQAFFDPANPDKGAKRANLAWSIPPVGSETLRLTALAEAIGTSGLERPTSKATPMSKGSTDLGQRG